MADADDEGRHQRGEHIMSVGGDVTGGSRVVGGNDNSVNVTYNFSPRPRNAASALSFFSSSTVHDVGHACPPLVIESANRLPLGSQRGEEALFTCYSGGHLGGDASRTTVDGQTATVVPRAYIALFLAFCDKGVTVDEGRREVADELWTTLVEAEIHVQPLVDPVRIGTYRVLAVWGCPPKNTESMEGVTWHKNCAQRKGAIGKVRAGFYTFLLRITGTITRRQFISYWKGVKAAPAFIRADPVDRGVEVATEAEFSVIHEETISGSTEAAMKKINKNIKKDGKVGEVKVSPREHACQASWEGSNNCTICGRFAKRPK